MLVAALVALACTLATMPLVTRALRRLQAFDHPTPRSSHREPTLRGGGIAPAGAMLVALVALTAVPGPERLQLAVSAAAFGAIGLADDLRGVGVFTRLALQGVAALVAVPVVALLDWPAWSGVVVVLWLVAFANAFNFMDGINGIACSCAIVSGAAWWVVGDAADVPLLAGGGIVAAAAALGFAPFNVLTARTFLGDVGSYFLGAWLALLAVVGLGEGAPPEAVLAPLALYLADTGTTLLRRVARGERWYEAHADHTYQRLVKAGWSHVATAVTVGVLMLATATLGMLAFSDSGAVRAAGDVGILAVTAGYLSLPALVSSRRRTSAALTG
ncbi:MAG TPA: glycosyltransferase family 4 protein [Acidimicrobiales bacterium]|nr:glycosyltransferase family 4 protein [Acidimicrobiales bacterium]